MFRFLIVPAIIGSFTFLIILFVASAITSETDIVAGVAGSILEISNRYFATTPPFIASYIANLNLAIVALTAGLVMMIGVQILVIVGAVLLRLFGGIVWLLRWERKKEPVRDLPPIDIDAKYLNSGENKKILGRGLDSIEPDR